MKKKLMLVLVMLISLSVVTGCGCGKKKSTGKDTKKHDVKVNTEKEVVKDREVEGIKLTNTSLITTDGVSEITTSVTNPTSQDYKLDEYRIIVKDEKGNVMITLPGYVGDTIKAGETRTIRSSVSMDLSKAKSLEYTVVK